MKNINIYTDGSIAVDGTITGYTVRQESAGTVVARHLNNGQAPARDLGNAIQMPKNRYSLSSEAGADEFKRDFLAAWA